MAITRNKKEEIVGDLNDWAQKSQAIIIVKYGGMTMPQLDKVRHAMRKAEGEFHVTKNTLATKVLKEHGLIVPEKWLKGQTAMSFCFKDPAAVAKSLGDLGKEFDKLQVMGGVMSGTTIIVRMRSRRRSIVRVAMTAGIAHAKPDSIGTNARPWRFIARITRSIR